MSVVAALLAIGFAQVFYTYFGYPLLIAILAKVFGKTTTQVQPSEWPSVSIVMVAYNEEARIAGKLRNLASFDYPPQLLQTIVVLDGCTDNTKAICAEFSGVEVIDQGKRSGKPAGLNAGVAQARGSVLLFVDVRQDLEPSTLKMLVTALNDPSVGAVGGELSHRDPATKQGKNVGLYWRYEKAIRKAESQFDSTVGVSGAIYAIARADYPGLKPDTILDDFEIPMHIARSGKRVLFKSDAIAWDIVQENMDLEAKRKLRTLQGNYQTLFRHLWLLNPFKNRLWFQYVSHKLCRLIAPYFLMLIFVCSLFGSGWFYKLLLAAQVLFYASAYAAKQLPALRNNKLIGVAYVFVEMNWSAVHALLKYVTSTSDAKWEKT